MEKDAKEIWKETRDYLLSLNNSACIPKLNFDSILILSSYEYQANYDDLFEENLKAVIELLKKNVKNRSLCVDFGCAFFIIVTCKWPNEIANFMILRYGQSFQELKSFLEELNNEQSLLLYLGMLEFIINFKLNLLSNEHHRAIDIKVMKEIELSLSNVENVDIVLRMADLWITLLLKTFNDREHLNSSDILKSLFSVIITYWNHILVHRSFIDPLVFKSLKYDFLKIKNINGAGSIKDTLIFRYVMDISWKIPFKYFLCRHLLNFAISQEVLVEIIDIMETELFDGFSQSLHNKNVIGVEAELFTLCLNHFPYETLKNIIHPLTCFALQDTNRSSYFAKRWLPQILKTFPDFLNDFEKSIFEAKNTNFKVLVTTLKICHLKKIPLKVTEKEESFLKYLTNLFSLPENIRGEVFSLLCELHDQSVLHSELELHCVFSFLRYNVNSNCAMLRNIMLSSFSKFILRLICSCVRVIKKNKAEADSKLCHAMKFLLDFNEFIADGMQPGCSYQRKISSLNLYKILMSYTVHECGSIIHRNNLNDAKKLVTFAKEKNSWKFDSPKNHELLLCCLMDSCEEIQYLASSLLISYFQFHSVYLNVYEKALHISNDNKFYKRNGGVAAITTCIAMAYKSSEEPCKTFNTMTSSFRQFFLNSLKKKIEIARTDILDAAVNYPMDADIKILKSLMADTSSPEFHQVTEEELEKLISMLEIIVPVLLEALFVDKSSDYAPSFEESDLALRMLINNSKICDSFPEDKAQCQLQPLYQLLLNFIWITLKFCADLESTLIVTRTDMNESQIIRCGNLIVSKLKFCRHKGVIEAAGISLSNIVKILTSQNRCETWLESIIDDILYMIEFKNGATVSRKSGGLSILVQHIIATDKRPKKPFIAKCWTEFQRILDVNYDSLNVDVSQELPQTHALHLLKVIAGDARNNADLLPYLEEIMLICLSTLNVPAWLIRNAALQLFGALLLKIVGLRNIKPQTGVRRSFEEIFLTLPKTLDHLISTLDHATQNSNKLVYHADLAPALVILSNVKLTSVIILNEILYQKVIKCRRLIENLLSSDLYTIRELAAKAILGLYSPKELLSKMNDIAESVSEYVKHRKLLTSENHLHGYLLIMKQIWDLYPESRSIVAKNRVKLCESLSVSLIPQTLLFNTQMIDVEVNLDTFFDHIINVIDVVESKRYLYIGYDQWLRAAFNVAMKRYDHIEILKRCLKCPYSVILMTCLDVLLECDVNESLFPALLECLDFHLKSQNSSMMNRIMDVFTQLHKSCYKFHCPEEFFNQHFDTLKQLNCYHFQGSNVHLLGILASNSGFRVDDILENIRECLNVTKYNKTIRLNSAQSMLNLSTKTDLKNADMKLIWMIIVELVQDEEADIRQIGSACFANIFHIEFDYGPEVTISALFNFDIVKKHLNLLQFIDLLWNKLKFDFVQQKYESDEDMLNPFDQGIINCYAEEVKIVKLAGEMLINIIQNDLASCKPYFSSCEIDNYFRLHKNCMTSNHKNYNNELLVESESYVINLRIYYLLFILKNITNPLSDGIDVCVENLKKVLHL